MTYRTLSVAMAALLLAGCGQGAGDSVAMRVIGSLTGQGGGARPGAAVPVETPGFTAQLIADNPQDFMIANVPTLGLNQPARLIRRNGSEETWQTQGGATLAFDQGVLVATRGLIDDLMVISSAGVPEALRARSGSVARTVESIDSLDRLSSETVTCTFTEDGAETVNLGLREVTLTKITEHCASSKLVFENAYWLDGSGAILQSRQFISAGVGYLQSNRL